jgi:carotenoid 1,2-hydratase
VESLVRAPGGPQPDPAALSGGREHAPRPGRADGGPVGPDGSREPALGPHFDQPVARDGYAWWYLDALSDDGRYGLTLIAFIGSVFSPYYALARRRGRGDPQHHCALNVALYGTGGRGWAMTERGRGSLSRTASTLTIGRSTLAWDGSSLLVEIDEVTAPLPSRIRGRVRLHPAAVTEHGVDLDGRGRHRWWPIAPKAQVELALDQPSLRWSGTGYLDTNSGDEPLEAGFTRWDWSRAPLRQGTAILYDAERRDGTRLATALHCHPSGTVEEFDPPPEATLPRTFWRVPRRTRADAGHNPTVALTLEDAPFYARSVLRTHLLGEPAMAVHESLSLDRFTNPLVQLMLPFRMPRAWG